jgi:hypothetical protein
MLSIELRRAAATLLLVAAFACDTPEGGTDSPPIDLLTSVDRLEIAEGDTTTFGLSLSDAPVGSDTVFVQSLNAPLATVSPAQVVFTAANYDTPVEIRVVAVHDADVRTDSTQIRFLAPGVGGLDVPVVVSDDDQVAILLTLPGGGIILDEGDSATVMLSLSHQPGLPVTIGVTPADTVTVAATPAQLIFTPGNWATPVPVKILARQDTDQNSAITTVRFTAPGLDTAQAGVRVTDDDELLVLLDDDNIGLAVGDSAIVNVSLSAFLLAPTDSVVVTVLSQTPGIVSAAPVTVTFTVANFDLPAPVMIKRVAPGVGIVRVTAPGYDANNVVVN